MALGKEMCGILAVGAQKERAARDFYLEAARTTKHPMGKRMFDRLADEEAKHEQLLQSWANQGICPVNAEFPPADKMFVKKGKAKVAEKVNADTGDLQAIEFGRDMERKAIAFYVDCAGKAADQGSKDLFMRIKAEEDKHLALLTDLYDFMVNPQLWSVRDEKANFDS
jgi:rubrerythrin